MSLRVVAVTIAVGLAGPAVAHAKLPGNTDKRVVLGTSIGGVRLGMSTTAAKALWGPGSRCGGGVCSWRVAPMTFASELRFSIRNGKVATIAVQRGLGGQAGVMRYRTAKNIHVNSTVAAVRRAYPAATLDRQGPIVASARIRTGATLTTFLVISGSVAVMEIGPALDAGA